jgi:HD-GYP domain-containing protein (c-di-GMP phosphodiesterase class II)
MDSHDLVGDVIAAAAGPLDSDHDPRYLEEQQAVAWVLEEVRAGRPLPAPEARAAAHSIYVSMRADGLTTLRLSRLHDMREYGSIHALNVAILSMGLAEQLGFGPAAICEIGLAGMLHDIGMVLVPMELIAKSEQLNAEDRRIIQQHPVNGARIIVESDASLALAAVVAYEHHLRMDGGGYPALRYPRVPHPITRLVQVCDTYHALRSPRPAREPWPNDVIFSFLQQRASSDFDPDMATRLIALIAMNED